MNLDHCQKRANLAAGIIRGKATCCGNRLWGRVDLSINDSRIMKPFLMIANTELAAVLSVSIIGAQENLHDSFICVSEQILSTTTLRLVL